MRVLMLALLLVIQAACSTLPPYHIQPVDKNQVEQPRQISDVIVQTYGNTKALCPEGSCACTIPFGDKVVIITTENFSCLLHEVWHSIIGPCHVGETECEWEGGTNWQKTAADADKARKEISRKMSEQATTKDRNGEQP